MKTEVSLSKGIIKRIVFIALVLLIILGIGVFAGTKSLNSITVKFSDGTELTVITSKTNVNDILKENNIYVTRFASGRWGDEEDLKNAVTHLDNKEIRDVVLSASCL